VDAPSQSQSACNGRLTPVCNHRHRSAPAGVLRYRVSTLRSPQPTRFWLAAAKASPHALRPARLEALSAVRRFRAASSRAAHVRYDRYGPESHAHAQREAERRARCGDRRAGARSARPRPCERRDGRRTRVDAYLLGRLLDTTQASGRRLHLGAHRQPRWRTGPRDASVRGRRIKMVASPLRLAELELVLGRPSSRPTSTTGPFASSSSASGDTRRSLTTPSSSPRRHKIARTTTSLPSHAATRVDAIISGDPDLVDRASKIRRCGLHASWRTACWSAERTSSSGRHEPATPGVAPTRTLCATTSAAPPRSGHRRAPGRPQGADMTPRRASTSVSQDPRIPRSRHIHGRPRTYATALHGTR
jgi:hypothetical protein